MKKALLLTLVIFAAATFAMAQDRLLAEPATFSALTSITAVVARPAMLRTAAHTATAQPSTPTQPPATSPYGARMWLR